MRLLRPILLPFALILATVGLHANLVLEPNNTGGPNDLDWLDQIGDLPQDGAQPMTIYSDATMLFIIDPLNAFYLFAVLDPLGGDQERVQQLIDWLGDDWQLLLGGSSPEGFFLNPWAVVLSADQDFGSDAWSPTGPSDAQFALSLQSASAVGLLGSPTAEVLGPVTVDPAMPEPAATALVLVAALAALVWWRRR